MDERSYNQGNATLAEGEHVEQHFENCNVNVVAGDLVKQYKITNNFPLQQSPNKGSPILQANDERWWDEARQKIIWKHVKGFVDKLNAYTWKNIQGNALDDYKDLRQHPMTEFNPQMKTGFDLFRGDYVPQEGFSAHNLPRVGENITFSQCVDEAMKNTGHPFAIIGQPGSGKTVLMKRLAGKLVAEKKIQDQKSNALWRKILEFFFGKNGNIADVILHVNIRDIPNIANATLAQILFSPSITGLTRDEAQYGLQAILENKIKIIIFFDGLDQANWEAVSEIKVGPWTKTNTATVFGNILSGNLLSNVPITISSREHSVACLSRDMRPEFIAALSGFSEEDAKALYCQIMGGDADNDWDEMRTSNPGMMYMCLTPLFLVFYMITRKKDPDDPPDCASVVMIRIIQILLESEHMGNLTKIINKLKQMAFHGTKEQRVVFTHEDLKMFGLEYRDISDVIIKVAGLNMLAQNILEGTYRFFFSHQTLQEVLSALYAVEMDLMNFKELVVSDFGKPYWSVVRNLSCGILKNERVYSRINSQILNKGEIEAKGEHLINDLVFHLESNPPPAEKLDIFVALKEANALEILRNHAENLDFSNSPLTPSMISVLCSVMKQLDCVPFLSLVNSGVDDKMLEVIANSTHRLEIKIVNFDVRMNFGWTDGGIWRKIFQNLTIMNCSMDLPRNNQNEINMDLVLQIVKYANENAVNLNWGELSIGMEELENLVKYDIKIKIPQLRMELHRESFDPNIWRKTFLQMPFTVDHLLIESKKRTSVKVLTKAAMAADVENVKAIYLESTAYCVKTDISDIALLAKPKFRGVIRELEVASCKQLLGEDWKELGIMTEKFDVRWLQHRSYPFLADFQSFVEGYSNIKAKLMEIRLYYERLLQQPRDVGQMISDCGFENLVFNFVSLSNFDVSSFASGLNGFKIKHFAVDSCLNGATLIEIVRQCNVEHLYIYEIVEEHNLKDLQRYTEVTIFSEEYWSNTFLYSS